MMGTPIHELEGASDINGIQGVADMQYGAMHNLQAEQGHNARHAIQQAQHNPYYSIPDAQSGSYPNYTQYEGSATCPVQPHHQVIPNHQGPTMEELAKEIGNTVPNASSSMELALENLTDEPVENDGGYLSFIPEVAREPLILLAVYMILSHPQVRTTLGQYINQINPGPTGRVSMTGVVIYGVILATLFTIIKKYLL